MKPHTNDRRASRIMHTQKKGLQTFRSLCHPENVEKLRKFFYKEIKD